MVLPTRHASLPSAILVISMLALGACGGSSDELGNEPVPSQDAAPTQEPAPVHDTASNGSDAGQSGGQSDSGGGSPGRVVVTEDTAADLADSLFSSTQALTEVQIFATLSATAEMNATSGPIAPLAFLAPPLPATNKVSLAQIAREVLDLTLTVSGASGSVARTAAEGAHACLAGGSWTLERVDVDGDGRVSAGDNSTVTFENCTGVLDGTVNGSLRQELTALEAVYDAEGFPTDISIWQANYVFTNFSYRRDGLFKSADGILGVDVRDDPSALTFTARFTAPALQVTEGQRSFTFAAFEAKTVVDDAQATISMEISGEITDSTQGSYTVQTPQAVVTPTANTESPTFVQGKIILSGASSTLTANFLDDGSVLWEIDRDGDGIVDSTRVD